MIIQLIIQFTPAAIHQSIFLQMATQITIPANLNPSTQQQQPPELLGVQALEEHVYIRFPADLAESIREDLRDVRKPSDLSITFTSERRAVVQIGASERLPAVLADLPTVTETAKSLEAGHGPSTTGQYCKVADAAQLLVVFSTDEQAAQWESQMRSVDFQLPDGLTAPMHLARQRRFNPSATQSALSKRRQELEAIEEQVKALLERDALATMSRFEYWQNGRLVRSSDGVDITASSTGNPATTIEPESEQDHDGVDEEADLVAEIEDELMHTAEEEIADARAERLKELEAKRSQLERVTNPAIRAFLEETIKQLELELQQ